jgi:hypothetical protein
MMVNPLFAISRGELRAIQQPMSGRHGVMGMWDIVVWASRTALLSMREFGRFRKLVEKPGSFYRFSETPQSF